MDFQTIILKLQKFWGEQKCILTQPYDIEKGAGTMNPRTFLRVLGPEPWRVAYVEPSRRPADGRYGDNPNRLFINSRLLLNLRRIIFRNCTCKALPNLAFIRTSTTSAL